MRNLAGAVLEILYPLRCGGCGAPGSIFCSDCTDTLLSIEEDTACPVCGRPLGARLLCGECLQERQVFAAGHYGYSYEEKLRAGMHAFKFDGRKDVGRHLVNLLKQRIIAFADTFDCIVPMPVTEQRLKSRGFNQSFIIAEEISKMANKAVYHSVLRKIRETLDQYSLSRNERKKNVKGAFAVTDGRTIRGKRVLLVDDLFTTGYTAKEACRALNTARVDTITLFALARTP